jgi:hypothetical protein
LANVFVLKPGESRAFFAAAKANAHLAILPLLGTAQSISMQLNDLSLKPGAPSGQAGLSHRDTLPSEIFCNLFQRPEDHDPVFFSALLCALWTRTKSGGYARYRIMHVCIRETDNITFL